VALTSPLASSQFAAFIAPIAAPSGSPCWVSEKMKGLGTTPSVKACASRSEGWLAFGCVDRPLQRYGWTHVEEMLSSLLDEGRFLHG